MACFVASPSCKTTAPFPCCVISPPTANPHWHATPRSGLWENWVEKRTLLPQRLTETLTVLLDEEHFRTRMAVLDALESLHSPGTLPALERLRARDLDGRVQRRVAEVIEAIRSARKQTDEVQQLRDDFQTLREENKKLLDRLDRLEARQPTGSST